MTIYSVSNDAIENAVIKVSSEIDSINRSHRTWKNYSEYELWSELVASILGSRVRYEIVRECIEHLQKKGLLEINNILNNTEAVKIKISNELNKSIYLSVINGKRMKYPYSKKVAKFIIQTCIEIYSKRSVKIRLLLSKCHNGYEARDLLVEMCMGIGPKQASLFLRNIFYCENLAILDSHVIRYMKLINLIKKFKKTTNKNQYLIYEKRLLSYANSLNKTLANLDLAIWVVMRLVQKEFQIWE
jgi:N-glycosylase/DNA lyase